MPLHITKIAYRSESPESLRAWLEGHAAAGGTAGRGGAEGNWEGEARLTTRYLPKRHEEMIGGSLYWILSGQLIGRSPILGFAERPDGKHWIRLAPTLIAVMPRAKRAHQGWRYLAGADAPPDLNGDGADGGDIMPGAMASELGKLGLL